MLGDVVIVAPSEDGMNRRGFLAGLLAIPAAAAVPDILRPSLLDLAKAKVAAGAAYVVAYTQGGGWKDGEVDVAEFDRMMRLFTRVAADAMAQGPRVGMIERLKRRGK